MTTTQINDVNIGQVACLAGAIQEKLRIGDTVWTASVSWDGGFRSEARIRDFDPVPSDEPLQLGGTDTAANPVEQLLGALGNCLAVGYAANATAAGLTIRDLRIDLTGDLNLTTFLGLGGTNAGYSAVRAEVHIDADATPEELQELHAKVVGTSPVGHTLSRPVAVDIRLGTTPCTFGGHRRWWSCPVCGRRCGTLYLTPSPACRQCLNLAYPSSRRTSQMEICMARLRRIGRKVGRPGLNLSDPWPPRPHGMQRRTYALLRDEWLAERDRVLGAAEAEAAALTNRVAALPR